ncbi:NAD-P-binding protein [Laetiporus sulphureus 93-53]|uniref:NAD-P-binding protein n=1 Tax=Laetiporus sulphureus 93-53 TaxID=1314785 RepID=A0A165HPH2_9APHY|nr:NAD-P-binding protein [Laetiporus sulphureus 93-53]KZT12008.1 NAD-P-binding protein [Laetiporus sulphureus 93-53]
MSSSQKTVLITGCSEGGIGDALARRFHEQGYEVFATARNLSSMEHLVSLGIKTLALDVTDLEAMRRVKAHIMDATGGKLHILVNNAGQAYPVAATDFDMKEVRDLFEVNLFAVMTTVQEFVHMLIASGDGRIVQTGSVSGIVPVPFSGAYNASKAGLHAYGNTIRVELAPFNIKVVTVITGAVKSNIAKPRTLPEDSLYRPMEAQYQALRINTSQQGAMDADKYAQDVVTEVTSKNPRAWFWAGNRTWTTWIIDTFLGRRGFDAIMTKMYGLDEFSAMVTRNKLKDI